MSIVRLTVSIVTKSQFENITEAAAAKDALPQVVSSKAISFRCKLNVNDDEDIQFVQREALGIYESVSHVSAVPVGIYDSSFSYLLPQESVKFSAEPHNNLYLIVDKVMRQPTERKRREPESGIIPATSAPSKSKITKDTNQNASAPLVKGDASTETAPKRRKAPSATPNTSVRKGSVSASPAAQSTPSKPAPGSRPSVRNASVSRETSPEVSEQGLTKPTRKSATRSTKAASKTSSAGVDASTGPRSVDETTQDNAATPLPMSENPQQAQKEPFTKSKPIARTSATSATVQATENPNRTEPDPAAVNLDQPGTAASTTSSATKPGSTKEPAKPRQRKTAGALESSTNSRAKESVDAANSVFPDTLDPEAGDAEPTKEKKPATTRKTSAKKSAVANKASEPSAISRADPKVGDSFTTNGANNAKSAKSATQTAVETKAADSDASKNSAPENSKKDPPNANRLTSSNNTGAPIVDPPGTKDMNDDKTPRGLNAGALSVVTEKAPPQKPSNEDDEDSVSEDSDSDAESEDEEEKSRRQQRAERARMVSASRRSSSISPSQPSSPTQRKASQKPHSHVLSGPPTQMNAGAAQRVGEFILPPQQHQGANSGKIDETLDRVPGLGGFEILAKIQPDVHDSKRQPAPTPAAKTEYQSSDEESEDSSDVPDSDEDSDEDSDSDDEPAAKRTPRKKTLKHLYG